MRVRRLGLALVVAVLAAAALAGGCATDGEADYRQSYYAGEPAPAAGGGARPGAPGGAPGAPAGPAAPGTRISIPPETTAELERFLARGTTLLGDRVEIDLSQVYFLASTSFTVSKDAVDQTETRDPARGLTTVRLVSNKGYETVYETMPKVYFGDGGLQVVAVEEIVLRYWTGAGAERPIWFRAVAEGSAVLLREGPPVERTEGDALRLSAAVERGADGAYRFTQSLEGGR